MTLPHQAPPVAASDLSALDPGIGRIIKPLSSHSPSGYSGVLMIGLAVLIVGGLLVGGWLIQKQMRPNIAEVQDGKKSFDADAKSKVPPKASDPAYTNSSRQLVKLKPSVVEPLEEPQPKAMPTFKSVWADAVRISYEWDAKEPVATQKALFTLALIDDFKAKSLMKTVDNEPATLSIYYTELSNFGLFDYTERVSRRSAMEKNGNYQQIVESLWNASVTAEQITKSASYWYISPFSDRFLVSQALEGRYKPISTSAVKLLASVPGGIDWLRGIP